MQLGLPRPFFDDFMFNVTLNQSIGEVSTFSVDSERGKQSKIFQEQKAQTTTTYAADTNGI